MARRRALPTVQASSWAGTIAATITKPLLDEPRRVQMAEYALGCARRFDWDAAARDVHAVMRRLVAAPVTPPRRRVPAEVLA